MKKQALIWLFCRKLKSTKKKREKKKQTKNEEGFNSGGNIARVHNKWIRNISTIQESIFPD